MSKREPYSLPDAPDGAALYWRSLEEKARLHDPSLYEERQAEFTREQVTPPDAVNRRGFLSLLGASMALAGAAGCRRPVEKIVPYAKMPEDVVPGVPSWYATSYARRGEAIGLLVESHEGRPTKIEGNPDHPASLGATDLVTQASILGLYDPDRSGSPAKPEGKTAWSDAWSEATWAEAEKALAAALLESAGGARLRFLLQPTASPTVMRLRDVIRARFPQVKFHTYAAVNDSRARAGSELAYGAAWNVLPAYDKAKVVLALDSDFLQTEPGNVRATRLFANGRRLRASGDPMSRLYVVEPGMSTTGASADHRLRLPATDVERYALALAAELATKHGVDLGPVADAATKHGKPDGFPAAWLASVAKDLAAAKGASVIVAGSRQPARVHALVHALNQALANVGTTVALAPAADATELDVGADLKALVAAMNGGQVDALVVIGGNPVYDAPADAGFAAALAKVKASFHLSTHRDETSARCTWHLPRSHDYEAWGDLRGRDGTLTVQQPLIAPLRDTRSDVEVLALAAGGEDKTSHALVRRTFAISDERAWKRVLRDGFVAGGASAAGAAPGGFRAADVAAAFDKRTPAPAPSRDALEVVFAPDPKLVDGRYGNNPWLLELPDPMTKIVWDNAALLSPATAKELGVKAGDVVSLTRGSATVKIVAWITPGHADNAVTVYLGWGRTRAGYAGNGKGFDVYPLRTFDAMDVATGVKLALTGERYRLAQTQEHDSMEGRPIAREATLATYREKPRFAELMAPPPAKSLPLWQKQDYSKGHRWGMTIDLNACTGCSACSVACQAENNIHIVGKEMVARGREMHWLRLDRYYLGDENDPSVAHQPMMCQQCEEAPCENVCPVNATVHSPEGLNDMAYNRCIGTRYCANNCPYKVRRFNYLDWKSEFWGRREAPDMPQEAAVPVDPPKTFQMAYNPDVTVRMRGVMEKCTYCVQRIQRAKIESKKDGRPIKDGEITAACAQACPAEAIVFGDLNDPNSRVAKLAAADRRYRLLEDLGTAPRTYYLAKVRNPNPEMEKA